MAAVKVEERLRKMERDGLGPNSIDPPRRVLLGIFRRATKAGLWYGPNPVEAWPRRRSRRSSQYIQKPFGVADLDAVVRLARAGGPPASASTCR